MMKWWLNSVKVLKGSFPVIQPPSAVAYLLAITTNPIRPEPKSQTAGGWEPLSDTYTAKDRHVTCLSPIHTGVGDQVQNQV
jgi:hypothetical protein